MITKINEFKKLLNENNTLDKYSEVYFKMDKFLPEDQELQEEYYEIIDSSVPYEDKIQELATFLNEYIDEESFASYMNDEEYSLSEFAKYIIDRDAVNPHMESKKDISDSDVEKITKAIIKTIKNKMGNKITKEMDLKDMTLDYMGTKGFGEDKKIASEVVKNVKTHFKTAKMNEGSDHNYGQLHAEMQNLLESFTHKLTLAEATEIFNDIAPTYFENI